MSAVLERIVLAALVLVGIGAVIIARDFANGTAHGGDLVPMLSGGVMAGLGVIALLRSAPPKLSTDGAKIWRPIALLASTVVFLWHMPIIGYPVVTPLWMAGTMMILGMRKIAVIVTVSLGLPLIAYLLLARVAFAPPPMGPFGAG